MKVIEIVKLVVSIIVCQAAGFLGSIFTTPAIPTWYASLKKPAFNPPNWLFAPVWTTLYLLMGIALFLIWRKGIEAHGVKMALIIFLIQLVLNILWSVAFFGLKSPLGGLIVIVILWIAILLTIVYFYKLSSIAGILLVPYIIWVSFAGILNVSLFTLNR
ncbi:MAG: tryptophan-rich sensory protein [candidate division WOR-3 bacterium]|nr:MAG: tryptophan-rich sensory protein [candidate division WOR-3 bacterium]